MALNFMKLLLTKLGANTEKISSEEVTCRELQDAALEFQLRELCWQTCVNLIANSLGRCEFRTFVGGKEVRQREYYLWNIEPNHNESSSAFLHKLISKLYLRNEALIISKTRRDGTEYLLVADQWDPPEKLVTKEMQYSGVVVDGFTFNQTFPENRVIHLKLNHKNIKPVIDAFYASYNRMVSAAMKLYRWEHGIHYKVHVERIASDTDWETKFQQRMEKQVKPFFEAEQAVLPEFEGYKYENIGSGHTQSDSRDIRNMMEDIFDFTARGLQIPAVMVNGKVESTKDATSRFLSTCIDPLCDQLQEEITRKRYGYDAWVSGNYLVIDSSSIMHFDLFENAANVEKLVGSGVFTINDILRSVNLPPIDEPWANEHYLTKNIADLGSAAKALGEGGKNEN